MPPGGSTNTLAKLERFRSVTEACHLFTFFHFLKLIDYHTFGNLLFSSSQIHYFKLNYNMGVIRKFTFSTCEDESTFDLEDLVNE